MREKKGKEKEFTSYSLNISTFCTTDFSKFKFRNKMYKTFYFTIDRKWRKEEGFLRISIFYKIFVPYFIRFTSISFLIFIINKWIVSTRSSRYYYTPLFISKYILVATTSKLDSFLDRWTNRVSSTVIKLTIRGNE